MSYANMQKGYFNMHRYIAFLKIIEAGSFTKAAELLGYTQPALSQTRLPSLVLGNFRGTV